MNDTDARIDTLCHEYLAYIQMTDSGFLTADERREVSAQRTIVHDELLLMTGLTRENTHMPAWTRQRLAGRILALLALIVAVLPMVVDSIPRMYQ
jgi:hypothetical protein